MLHHRLREPAVSSDRFVSLAACGAALLVLACSADPSTTAGAATTTTGSSGSGGQTSCAPSCAGRECGDDTCGGSCGTCPAPSTCVDGACSCTPSCEGKECGDDGCNSMCGTCTGSNLCKDDSCVAADFCMDAPCDSHGACCEGAPHCTDKNPFQPGDMLCSNLCGDDYRSCFENDDCCAGYQCFPDDNPGTSGTCVDCHLDACTKNFSEGGCCPSKPYCNPLDGCVGACIGYAEQCVSDASCCVGSTCSDTFGGLQWPNPVCGGDPNAACTGKTCDGGCCDAAPFCSSQNGAWHCQTTCVVVGGCLQDADCCSTTCVIPMNQVTGTCL